MFDRERDIPTDNFRYRSKVKTNTQSTYVTSDDVTSGFFV